MEHPTLEYIKAHFLYNPDTGHLIYKKSKRKGWAGKIAGSPSHGYLLLQIEKIHYRVHHVIWFYMTGEWPHQLDHINGNRNDNRWTNLRLANALQNNWNKKKYKGLLPKGVTYRTHPPNTAKRYFARIECRGKQIFLGNFFSAEEAHKAYQTAARQYFGEFARFK